jgi:DNA-binding XRE family transcriptional regulator
MSDNAYIMSLESIPSKASTPKEFGEIFRAEREALGMTQQDVASAVKCRRQTIGDMEDGKNVRFLTILLALSAISKCLAIKSNRLEIEDINAFLEDGENG